MTAMNIVNLMFVFFSGYLAVQCFQVGATFWGWFNLFASAMNAASVLLHI